MIAKVRTSRPLIVKRMPRSRQQHTKKRQHFGPKSGGRLTKEKDVPNTIYYNLYTISVRPLVCNNGLTALFMIAANF